MDEVTVALDGMGGDDAPAAPSSATVTSSMGPVSGASDAGVERYPSISTTGRPR